MTKISRMKYRGRKHFYRACVQYVKKRQGNFIAPQHTAYSSLVKQLEYYAEIEPDFKKSIIDRCLVAAGRLSIPIPPKPHPVLKRTADGFTFKPPKASNKDHRWRFYRSAQWKKLRYATLKKYDGRCMACKCTDKPLQVDHIKPISKYWALRLDPNNMQVLCGDCNWGKLNIDTTDWREEKVIWGDKWEV